MKAAQLLRGRAEMQPSQRGSYTQFNQCTLVKKYKEIYKSSNKDKQLKDKWANIEIPNPEKSKFK